MAQGGRWWRRSTRMEAAIGLTGQTWALWTGLCKHTCGLWMGLKLSSGHRTGKGQFSLQSQRKAMPNNVQTRFRKDRGSRDQIANIRCIIEEWESSRKTSISALLTMPKPLYVCITTNCGKFFKRWEYQSTSPTSWEICMQVKKQQLELDMEQQTGSK